MNKRATLLVLVGAILVFTLALVAFSVYTVNTATAAAMNTAPMDQPANMTTAVTSNRAILTNLSSDSANSVEVTVQHIGTECHGGEADTPTY